MKVSTADGKMGAGEIELPINAVNIGARYDALVTVEIDYFAVEQLRSQLMIPFKKPPEPKIKRGDEFDQIINTEPWLSYLVWADQFEENGDDMTATGLRRIVEYRRTPMLLIDRHAKPVKPEKFFWNCTGQMSHASHMVPEVIMRPSLWQEESKIPTVGDCGPKMFDTIKEAVEALARAWGPFAADIGT
jgi:hypothetical protein